MNRRTIGFMMIGWLIVAGISPCAGESSQAVSSSFTLQLSGSGRGYQKTFQQAAQWYRESNWERAAQAFAQSAQQASNSQSRWEALFYEAECLVQQGDYGQAHSHYGAIVGETSIEPLKVRSRLPQTQLRQAQLRQAQFRLGETAWLAGYGGQAEIALQQFIQQYPDDSHTARALLYLGDLAIAENHQRQAAGYYRRILEQSPDSSQVVAARLGLGQVLLAQGEPERAMAAVEPLTTVPEGPGEAWLLLAQAYYRQGKFEDALTKIRELPTHFEQDDLASRAHLVAAWALWRLGRFDLVSDELTPLDSISQRDSEVQYLLGMTAYAQKKWEKAAHLLSSAALIAKPSTQDVVLFYAGESSRLAGLPVQARQCFDQLLKEMPESKWAADANLALRQMDSALRQMDLALQQKDPAPRQMDSALRQMDLTPQQKDPAPRQPDHPGPEVNAKARLREAQRLQRDGRLGAAIATYHELLDPPQGPPPDDLPAHPVVLWEAGRLHERLGQFSEAGSLYEQLLNSYPRNPHAAAALFRLGEMARQQGNLGQGAKYYRQVQTKFPQTGQAREAAYWLALLAADNKDGPTAHRYTDWLLRELSAERSLGSLESSFQRPIPETPDRDLERGFEERTFVGQPGGQPATPWPGQSTLKRETNSRNQQLLIHAMYLKSQLAAREGKWDQVRSLVARLLEDVPTGELRTSARFWQAEAEFRLGHDEEAGKRFRDLEPRVLGLEEPWVPMVSLRQAQLAAGRQQWTHVLQWTKKLRSNWPEFPLAYEVDYLCGQALAGRGEMSPARVAYQRVLDSSLAKGTETAAMAQWMIGETHFHQHQYQQAREAYDRVIDQHVFTNWQALAALQSGKCWELEGYWKQARKLYVDALRRKPGEQPAKELRARLRWAEQTLDSSTKR